jgi:non-specific serine/threonine protein kinase
MNNWTSMPDLPTARGGLAATTLAGRCYVFGGEYLGKSPTNTFPENEGFDFATRTWQTYAPLPTPRHGLATVALGDRIYVLLGGPQAALNFSDTVEIFSP